MNPSDVVPLPMDAEKERRMRRHRRRRMEEMILLGVLLGMLIALALWRK